MLKPYRTIDDVLRSTWAAAERPGAQPSTDRVLRSTKLEDSIYADLRDGDDGLEQAEGEAAKKLPSFPALSRDVFQSFYSLMPRKNDHELLTTAARKFNSPILEHITQCEDYSTLKAVCEGRELPAYEASSEFVARTAGELDSLLSSIGGEKNALNTLEKLEQGEQQAQRKLAGLLERMRAAKEHDPLLERSIVDTANQAEGKRRQVEAVGKLVDTNAAKSSEDVAGLVAGAVSAAAEKAQVSQHSLRMGVADSFVIHEDHLKRRIKAGGTEFKLTFERRGCKPPEGRRWNLAPAGSAGGGSGAADSENGLVGAVDGGVPGKEGGVRDVHRELGEAGEGGGIGEDGQSGDTVIRTTATAAAAGIVAPAGAARATTTEHDEIPPLEMWWLSPQRILCGEGWEGAYRSAQSRLRPTASSAATKAS